MTPHYADDAVTLYHGDCMEVLAALPDASVDAVVTDPPYGLEFMGKDWDAPWKSTDGAVHARARVERAEEMGEENKRRFIAAGVNKFQAGKPFQDWCTLWTAECLRVLKPGGHLLAFGGSRTWHRLAVAVEDAGFEIRDSIAWLYGSGFPKSLDVSKAIERELTREMTREMTRELEFTAWMRTTGVTSQQLDEATGTHMGGHYLTAKSQPSIPTADLLDRMRPLLPPIPEWIETEVAEREERKREAAERNVGATFLSTVHTKGKVLPALDDDAPDEAHRWAGWGTALKPAFEPVVVARKPLAGTVAANVLAHGTGALNIDGCRVGTGDDRTPGGATGKRVSAADHGYGGGPWAAADEGRARPTGGRWPANVVLDESQAAELDRQSGTLKSGANPTRRGSDKFRDAYGEFQGQEECTPARGADTGGASRFFPTFRYQAKAPAKERPRVDGVAHPTVKPLALMRWMVRLVTPPGGVVLDPFAGSGTTAEACVMEGVRCIAIEREAEYLPLIEARLSKPIQAGLDLGEIG